MWLGIWGACWEPQGLLVPVEKTHVIATSPCTTARKTRLISSSSSCLHVVGKLIMWLWTVAKTWTEAWLGRQLSTRHGSRMIKLESRSTRRCMAAEQHHAAVSIPGSASALDDSMDEDNTYRRLQAAEEELASLRREVVRLPLQLAHYTTDGLFHVLQLFQLYHHPPMLCVFMCSSSLDLCQPLILFKIMSVAFALYTLDCDFPFLPVPLSAFTTLSFARSAAVQCAHPKTGCSHDASHFDVWIVRCF